MPKNRKAWSSWNAILDKHDLSKNCVTYWLNRLQNKVYRSKIENSAKWQRDQIKQLYQEKVKLQVQLDRLKGIFFYIMLRTRQIIKLIKNK